jgi:hypothetical protein
MPNKAKSENDVLKMHNVGNYEDLSCIDNSLQCWNENEDCEEATVEQIAAKHQKTSYDQKTKENDMTKHEQVTNMDASSLLD